MRGFALVKNNSFVKQRKPMFLINRFLPFGSALLIVILFEIWAARPTASIFLAAAGLVVVVGTVWLLTGVQFFQKASWNFLIPPLLFLIGAVSFFLFIDYVIVRHLFIASIGVGYFLMFHNTFVFFRETKSYQPHALENIYSYIDTVSLFLLCASGYGLKLFMGWPMWPFILLMLLATGVLFRHTLWAHKIDWRKSRLFVLIMSLLLAESSYVVSFLPTSYLFNSLMVIFIYYLLMQLVSDHLLNELNSRTIKKYVLISASAIVVALLTARWY